MLFKDLCQFIDDAKSRGIHPYAFTNIDAVEIMCGNVLFDGNAEEIKKLKDSIKNNEDVIKNLEEELKAEKEKGDQFERKLNETSEIITQYKDNKGGFLRELLERNDYQASEIEKYKGYIKQWKNKVDEQDEQLKKLRTRANKGVITRCVKTGRLICEFNSEKFYLETIKSS